MFGKTKRIISAVITVVMMCALLAAAPAAAFADTVSPIADYKLAENLIGSCDMSSWNAGYEFWADSFRNMSVKDGTGNIGLEVCWVGKPFDKVYSDGVFVFSFDVLCGADQYNQYGVWTYNAVQKYSGGDEYDATKYTHILDAPYPGTTGYLKGNTAVKFDKDTKGEWKKMDLVIDFENKVTQLYIDDALFSEANDTSVGVAGVVMRIRNEDGDKKDDPLRFDNFAMYYTAPKKFTATEMKVVKEDGTKVTLPSDIKAGDKLTLTASLHNTMGGEKPYMVSYAVYNGNMLTAVDFVEATLANNGSVTESFDYTVTNTENLKIKILVWDGIDTMTPYAGCYYAIQ